jgi:hypothetical protein
MLLLSRPFWGKKQNIDFYITRTLTNAVYNIGSTGSSTQDLLLGRKALNGPLEHFSN